MKVQPLLPQPFFESQLKVLRLRSSIGDVVFIRFICGEVDEVSHVAAGLFRAAYDLWRTDWLPKYELDAIEEVEAWFCAHMKAPFDYLPHHPQYEQSICWFKSTAREHLAHAWELVTILERNGVFIWTVKSARPGHVHYEDDVQVLARPYPEVRLLLKR